jgi:tRNA pseudouridine55 synthase
MNGFLNLNKPLGITSHDCVSRVRRLLKLKRVGHGGTLDPAANGVLPIALGKTTRLLQFLPSDKAYLGRVRFGVTTTTDDLEGDILTSHPVSGLSLADVEAILPQFFGKIAQIPPIYSAIHVDGKRLYDLARKGEIVTVEPRTVEVYKLEIVDWFPGEFPEVLLAISCGAGTYIRSIARDLGSLLNIGGTLAGLTRTQSSGFSLENSLTFERLESQLKEDLFQPISPSEVLNHLESIALSVADTKRWHLGQRLGFNDNNKVSKNIANETLMVYNEEGVFLGIGEKNPSETGYVLSPKIVF